MTLAELSETFGKNLPRQTRHNYLSGQTQAVAGARLVTRRARFGLSGVTWVAGKCDGRIATPRDLRRAASWASAR